MESKANLFQRLSRIMADVAFIGNEDKKVNGQYSYVGHNAVSQAVREAMITHGVFSYIRVLETAENGNCLSVKISMRFTNCDDPTEFIDAESCGMGIDTSDKKAGKGLSYAVKLCLLKTFLIPTGDSSDDVERDNIPFSTEPIESKPAKKKAWD